MLSKVSNNMVKHVGQSLSSLELKPDAVIVGGGISGLTAARRLRESGLVVLLLEKARRLGGIWSGRGTYECLRLQQHKDVFRFDGVEWPSSTPDYPKAHDVKSQIAAYVKKHRLDDCIQLGAQVTAIKRDEQFGLWRTRYIYDECSPEIEIESRFVALATGSLGSPIIPKGLESSLQLFQGSKIHSADYYRPTSYKNRNVIVIGWGASSVEIAADLANRGDCNSVTLVAPPKFDENIAKFYEDWCLSRDLGREITKNFCADPTRSEASLEYRNDLLRDAMATRHPGLLEALPPPLRPKSGPIDGRIIVSEAFNDALLAGKIRVIAASIIGAEPNALHVKEASPSKDIKIPATDLIICTGYTPPLPRLSNLMQPKPTSTDFYDTMWAPECPNAAFLGLGFGFISISLLCDLQAKRLAQVATGSVSLPSVTEMNAWISSVKAKNLMGTTQCLTDNKYFSQLFGGINQQSSTITAAIKTPLTTSSRQQLNTSVRQFSTQATPDESKLSSVGQEINSSRFSSEDPSKAYAAWAETYDDDSFEVLKFDSPYTTRDYVLAYWPTTQEKNIRTQILDVGCGTGAVARLVHDELPHATTQRSDWHGLDLTPEMLAVAKRRGQYNTLRQWSITDTPWPVPENAFDLAPCNGVLMYVKPQLSVFAEFCRAVKPGGHAILMIRDDNIDAWQPHMDELERQRAWRLIEVSEPRDNFPGRDDNEPPIMYRIYVLRILPRQN
uniref:Methyltransferase type 11 domain-containing protein n=1 Tax=Aureoumbra lagunensis TaxID=44058 RepID=A0A7S3NFE2_9STRA